MIIIDDAWCKGCDICIQFCPKHILEASTEANSRGYYTPRVTDWNACNNCRQCELLCPDFAIFIIEDGEVGDR
ncbi:MAG: 4Fe-4S dicluster domain-containing protein [Planctomycetota bacterium]|jgi:2-oxoglutarate ferredoxin oxidoreductase subunit delta